MITVIINFTEKMLHDQNLQIVIMIINILILLVYIWIASSTRKQTKILIDQWERSKPRAEFYVNKHQYRKDSKMVPLIFEWRGPGMFSCKDWWYDDGKQHLIENTKHWTPPEIAKSIPGKEHIELAKKIFVNSEAVYTCNEHDNKRRYDIDPCTLREIRCLLLDEKNK